MDSLNRVARRRRTILLCLAAGTFLLSLTAGPQPWPTMANRQVSIEAVGAAYCGLLTSIIISSFAAVMGFDLNQRPWYAQKGGLAFTLAAALCLDFFFGACAWLAIWLGRVDLTDSVMPVPAAVLVGIAAQLASVALISWPSWLVRSKWSRQVPNSQMPDSAHR